MALRLNVLAQAEQRSELLIPLDPSAQTLSGDLGVDSQPKMLNLNLKEKHKQGPCGFNQHLGPAIGSKRKALQPHILHP